MATKITAMDMVRARQARGYAAQPVDEDAVAQFVAGAEGQPREKIIVVVQRMHSMIERGERARGPKGYVSLETMATAADRLAGLQEDRTMAQATVTAWGIQDALGRDFDGAAFFSERFFTDNEATLTTEHPTSSHGLPVLVYEGQAYGPGDLPGVVIYVGETELTGAHMTESARAAGWTVRVSE